MSPALNLLRPRPRYALYTGTGLLTGFPSNTPFGFSLGPDSPWADDPSPGILRLSGGWILTILSYTHAWILTSASSSSSHESTFSLLRNALLPIFFRFRGFGGWLQPRTFSAQHVSTGELLRTLLMMAASKPTSRLSRTYHFLPLHT